MAVLLLALLVSPARGEGAEEAARELGAAWEAGDPTRLGELAAALDPDPWLVVEAALAMGFKDAAEAYAKATRGADRADMVRYVSEHGREAATGIEATRRGLAEVQAALERGDADEALRLLDRLGREGGTLGIRARELEGRARLIGEAPLEGEVRLAEAARMARELGWLGRAASLYEEAGALAQAAGRLADARERWQAASDVQRARGLAIESADLQANVAFLHAEEGALRRALEALEPAIQVLSTVPGQAGRALEGQGVILLRLGRYREAMQAHELAMEACKVAGDVLGMALNLAYLGVLHDEVGANADAVRCLEQARKRMPEDAPPPVQAHVLGNLAVALGRAGRFGDAERLLAKTQEIFEAMGAPTSVARVQENRGYMLAAAGRHADALARYAEAAAVYEERKDRVGLATLGVNRGESFLAVGDLAAAQQAYASARERAVEQGLTREEVGALLGLVRVARKQRKPAPAVELALTALERLPDLVGGLSLAAGAAARTFHGDVFEEGALAALEAGDRGALFRFLEAGRAGSLLEFLGGTKALQRTALSPALKHALEEAAGDLTAATLAHQEALQTRHLATERAARESRDAALQRYRDAQRRVVLEQKLAANVLFADVLALGKAKEGLASDEALVLYAVMEGRLYALVATREDERVVDLGALADAEALVGKARFGERGGFTNEVQTELRKLLLQPLGLGASTPQLLISPAGVLHGIPFQALLPEQPVTLVPSATAHAALAGVHVGGEGRALALGGVDYAGTRHGPLPQSSREAKAVGDEVLEAGEATERGLLETVETQEGWRLILLSCHGDCRTDVPLDSALLLTPGKTAADGDGRLTGHEILGARFPAELVVLAACDVGRGSVYTGEGLVGLTQAFFLAGSRRVVANLWQAEDESATAFVIELDRLLESREAKNVADAVRRAQRHVREARPEWEDPFYWAGWVLWGPP